MLPVSRPVETLGHRLLGYGFWLTVAAVAAQTAAHWTNAFLLDDRVWNFDADVEGNTWTWASAMATFAGGLAALLWGFVFEERRREFLALGAILTFFSLDDVIRIHEQLGLEVGGDVFGLPDYLAVRLWTAFYMPLLLLTAYLLWELARVVWRPAGEVVTRGLALLVAAFVVELLGAFTRAGDEDQTEWPENLRTGVEEGLELAGWMLIATALLAAFCLRLASSTEPKS